MGEYVNRIQDEEVLILWLLLGSRSLTA